MMTDPYGQTNPRPMTTATTPTQPSPVGAFTPRMLLAIAAIYNPAMLIAYLLYLYGPSNSCVLGGLCNFANFPGILQMILLAVGAAVLGAIIFVPLWWLLDEARPAHDPITRTVRDAARFVTIRPLLVSYGALLVLLLFLGVLLQRVPPPLFLVGLSSALICFWCASAPEYTPLPAPVPQPQQPPSQRPPGGSSSAFLRDSPPPRP